MSFRCAPLSGLRPIPILWILPSLLSGSGPCKDSGTGVFYSHYLLNFGSQMTNLYRPPPPIRILNGSGQGFGRRLSPG